MLLIVTVINISNHISNAKESIISLSPSQKTHCILSTKKNTCLRKNCGLFREYLKNISVVVVHGSARATHYTSKG
jgi:hypothetical protein